MLDTIYNTKIFISKPAVLDQSVVDCVAVFSEHQLVANDISKYPDGTGNSRRSRPMDSSNSANITASCYIINKAIPKGRGWGRESASIP